MGKVWLLPQKQDLCFLGWLSPDHDTKQQQEQVASGPLPQTMWWQPEFHCSKSASCCQAASSQLLWMNMGFQSSSLSQKLQNFIIWMEGQLASYAVRVQHGLP